MSEKLKDRLARAAIVTLVTLSMGAFYGEVRYEQGYQDHVQKVCEDNGGTITRTGTCYIQLNPNESDGR